MGSSRTWVGLAGRGSRGGFFTPGRTFSKKEEQPETPQPPYGELLLEIERSDISKATYDPKIKDCKYVASYSWLDRGTPTVMIPGIVATYSLLTALQHHLMNPPFIGKPPAWTPPATNRRLDSDKGDFFRDPNAARFPNYPIEPAVRAVLKQNSQFSTKDIDLFTCASALGNLSRYVRGVDREFRFVMGMVGNTVFFVRRERSPTELIPNVRGYGHTFPEEYTSWERDVKGSESHQRIIQYGFGELRLLVRFESDGYFRKDKTSRSKTYSDSLIDAFGDASISHVTVTNQEGLRIEEGGQPVPQKDVFDIKTRSVYDFKTRTIKKEIDMTDIIPRLWVSQIPTLIVGFHDRGLFDDIRVQDMRKEIEKWEKENEESIRQLVSLLHDLIEFAAMSRTNLEICRSETGPLQIRRLAGEGLGILPSKLKARWIGDEEGGEEAGPEEGDSPRSERNTDDGF